MTEYTQEPMQVGGSAGRGKLRVWAYTPGAGAVIVANFNSSHVLRLETKIANARRMVACWNLCAGVSTEDIEEIIRYRS